MRCRIAGLIGLALIAASGFAWAQLAGNTTDALDATKARQAECGLGNLVADAARSVMKAELALVPASEFRSVILPAGDLTRDALTKALLFPDGKIALVELTGQQIKLALERSLCMLPNPNTGFLQVSGMTVTFRSDAAVDNRVLGVQADGSPLVVERKYRVAMPASLAKGALGYFRIFGELQPQQTGPAIGEAVVDYVAGARTVGAQLGRLRDLSRPTV